MGGDAGVSERVSECGRGREKGARHRTAALPRVRARARLGGRGEALAGHRGGVFAVRESSADTGATHNKCNDVQRHSPASPSASQRAARHPTAPLRRAAGHGRGEARPPPRGRTTTPSGGRTACPRRRSRTARCATSPVSPSPPPHARTELSGLLALDLSGCGHVTDEGVSRVARGLHRPTFPLPSTAADGNDDRHRAQGASACSPCGCPGAPRSPTPAALTWQVPSPRHATPHPPPHRPPRTALRSLRSLDLSATDITDEGVRRLRGVQDRLPLFFSFLFFLRFFSFPILSFLPFSQRMLKCAQRHSSKQSTCRTPR